MDPGQVWHWRLKLWLAAATLICQPSSWRGDLATFASEMRPFAHLINLELWLRGIPDAGQIISEAA